MKYSDRVFMEDGPLAGDDPRQRLSARESRNNAPSIRVSPKMGQRPQPTHHYSYYSETPFAMNSSARTEEAPATAISETWNARLTALVVLMVIVVNIALTLTLNAHNLKPEKLEARPTAVHAHEPMLPLEERVETFSKHIRHSEPVNALVEAPAPHVPEKADMVLPPSAETLQ